jgi:hypothetical protein
MSFRDYQMGSWPGKVRSQSQPAGDGTHTQYDQITTTVFCYFENFVWRIATGDHIS